MTANSSRRSSGKSFDPLSDEAPALHYLYRTPSPVIAIITVLAALAILSLAIHELQSQESRQMAVGVNAAAHGENPAAPQLEVTEETLIINNQPVAPGDAVFRLSGLAAIQRGIIIKYPLDLSADRLAAAIDLVNKAGFSQVSLQSAEADKETTSTR